MVQRTKGIVFDQRPAQSDSVQSPESLSVSFPVVSARGDRYKKKLPTAVWSGCSIERIRHCNSCRKLKGFLSSQRFDLKRMFHQPCALKHALHLSHKGNCLFLAQHTQTCRSNGNMKIKHTMYKRPTWALPYSAAHTPSSGDEVGKPIWEGGSFITNR